MRYELYLGIPFWYPTSIRLSLEVLTKVKDELCLVADILVCSEDDYKSSRAEFHGRGSDGWTRYNRFIGQIIL